MHITSKYISPAKLLILTWSIALIAAYFGVRAGLENDVYTFRDVKVHETFTLDGLVWIAIVIIVFALGTITAQKHLIIIKKRTNYNPTSSDSVHWIKSNLWLIRSGLIGATIFTLFIFCLLFFWTLLAIIDVGGLSNFINLTYNSWHTIRRLWPAQKPFLGARLLYTGLISTFIFSMVFLALLEHNNPHDEDTCEIFANRVRLLTMISVIPLMILPLIVSQRLLIATAISGGIAGYIVMSPSGINIKYPTIGTILGFSVWTAQETLRGGLNVDNTSDAIQLGINRLLFYFLNNVGNLNRAVAYIDERSYGLNNFSFFFEILLIDDHVNEYLLGFNAEAGQYLAGGTFTALGTPYLDFGVAGLILIFIWGYLSQVSYVRATNSVFWAQIYALFAASIILSFQTTLWAQPFFWLNIILILFFTFIIPNVRYKLSYTTESDQ